MSGLSFPVGLAAAPDGALWVSEAGAGRVVRLEADGQRSVVATLSGAPMGVARTRGGGFVVADNGGKYPPAPSNGDESGSDAGTPAVYRVAADGTMTTLVTAADDHAVQAPNGMCVDDAGGAWFTDAAWDFRETATGRGSLVYIAADGTSWRVPTDLRFPSALAFDASGDTLFVTESLDGGVWAFDVRGPGRLGSASLLAWVGPDVLPSGIAVDGDGRLLVCGHMSGCVHVFDRAGAVVETLDAGRSAGLAHIAFGGPDLTAVYVTASASGEVLSTTWRAPGLPLRS